MKGKPDQRPLTEKEVRKWEEDLKRYYPDKPEIAASVYETRKLLEKYGEIAEDEPRSDG